MKKFNKLFTYFLYIQPILDVTCGIFSYFKINTTISSIIRFTFLIICIFYLLKNVKDKKLIVYFLLLSTYFIGFTITILTTKDINCLTYELRNTITTFYFVILFLTLIFAYKNNNFNLKSLFYLYIIYLVVTFIPMITNTGFNSYSYSKKGSSGWFASANQIGSILSLLLPICILYIKKINIKLLLITFINIYVILNLGTKQVFLSFGLVIFLDVIYYIIYLFKNRYKIKLISTILICFLAFICLFGIAKKSAFYKNITIHVNHIEKKYNGKVSSYNFINNIIFSERLTFLNKTKNAYNNSNLTQKIFGIGYIENYATDKVSTKTIEIDYFDIFYRHGLFGFLIFFTPVLYITKKIFKGLKFNFINYQFLISIFLAFILAFFQGHIFTSAQVSIYLAIILSILYNKNYIYDFKKIKS